MAEQCGNCRFRSGANAKFTATNCRRYPPVSKFGLFTTYTVYPLVRWNAWCGEYQPEPEGGRKPISPKEYRDA